MMVAKEQARHPFAASLEYPWEQLTPEEGEKQPRYLYFGIFRGEVRTTEEDFDSAEFHGDPDDGLDWS